MSIVFLWSQNGWGYKDCTISVRVPMLYILTIFFLHHERTAAAFYIRLICVVLPFHTISICFITAISNQWYATQTQTLHKIHRMVSCPISLLGDGGPTAHAVCDELPKDKRNKLSCRSCVANVGGLLYQWSQRPFFIE